MPKNIPAQFMLADNLNDVTICDRLIDFFNKNPDLQTPGECGRDDSQLPIVDESMKVSTDISILVSDAERFPMKYAAVREYLMSLHNVVNAYIDEYPWSNAYSKFGIVECFNMQYYKPNEGFKIWHTERAGGEGIHNKRHLVWMTYLNDVTDAGETAFFHQELKFKPKKGLTLIWPADWTFTHKGIPSPTQDKYIITGWLNFID